MYTHYHYDYMYVYICIYVVGFTLILLVQNCLELERKKKETRRQVKSGMFCYWCPDDAGLATSLSIYVSTYYIQQSERDTGREGIIERECIVKCVI